MKKELISGATDLLNRMLSIGERLEKTDSKQESDAIKSDLLLLSKEWRREYDGLLININSRTYRIWHSHYGTFKAYGNKRDRYTYTGNFIYIDKPISFEILEEDDELIEEANEIDSEVAELESQIGLLKEKKRFLLKDFCPKIDPNNFQETDELDRNAFSLSNGEHPRISESFCQLTGIRVTS